MENDALIFFFFSDFVKVNYIKCIVNWIEEAHNEIRPTNKESIVWHSSRIKSSTPARQSLRPKHVFIKMLMVYWTQESN